MYCVSIIKRWEVLDSNLPLFQLLTNTGVFLGHQGELLVWLEHLAQFSASGSQGQQQQQHLLAFLDKALVNLLVNPHSHTDRVMDVVAEAMMLETSTTGDDKEDTASIMTLDGGIDGRFVMTHDGGILYLC